jgi:hypothetical protein
MAAVALVQQVPLRNGPEGLQYGERRVMQMNARSSVPVAAFVGGFLLVLGASLHAQSAGKSATPWTPARLPDGQPDIQGMWNNEEANFTPLELPKELQGRTSFTPEELRARAEALAKQRKEAGDSSGPGDVGFYALYWFDWYWRTPAAGDWPALLVEPKTGRMPAMTPEAQKTAAYMREHLHDSFETMEAGDRCISRGVLGMMMPTAYNNGKLIVQSPGYVMILSEMIHNARIIPIVSRPHVDPKIRYWEGDPRGHWEGNTLVVESTNFKAVDNLRSASGRARHGGEVHDRRCEHAEVFRHGGRPGYLHESLDGGVPVHARRQVPAIRVRVPREQLLSAQFPQWSAHAGKGYLLTLEDCRFSIYWPIQSINKSTSRLINRPISR